jgi:hypothetical protein
MPWILRLVWLFVGQHMKKRMIKSAKRQGVLAYIQVLQASRRLVILALVGFFVLQTMVLSFFGALIAGFMLWNGEFEFKMELLFGIFLGMLALPAIGLLVLISERVWYKASGAEKMVNEVTDKKSA